MKTKLTMTLLTVFTIIAFNVTAADEKGYHIRMSWVGDASIDLILRNPKDPDINSFQEPFDCYFGQKSPDWGIIGQDLTIRIGLKL